MTKMSTTTHTLRGELPYSLPLRSKEAFTNHTQNPLLRKKVGRTLKKNQWEILTKVVPCMGH